MSFYLQSSLEQTSHRDLENAKPVYCYQCAKKGHYGYVCKIIII